MEYQPIDDKFNFTQRSLRSNNLNDYEDLLQKLENDIRNHIKCQHQYRIYSDNLKLKIEELEKVNKGQKNIITHLNEVKFFFIYHFLFIFLFCHCVNGHFPLYGIILTASF